MIITLTTDFGNRDGFVGAMKGVIARLSPQALIVDLAHDVPRHDIAHGAWVLATACREFPAGTIHLAVVDPGVGSDRLEVIVAAGGHTFVGPDNGLFHYVAGGKAAGQPAVEGTWAITSSAFRFPEASPTFHGRDVFAPAAAALARGLPPEAAGPATCLAGALAWPRGDDKRGHIVHLDQYGNLISDLRPSRRLHAVRIAGRELPLARTYNDVVVGQPLAYVGSMGTVEVAIRQGNAAALWQVQRGTLIEAVDAVEASDAAGGPNAASEASE